jgi:NADPH2:quinone reductase
MKAIRVHAPGGAEVLRYEDAPDPVPRAGEALVRVEAAGLNYIDVYYRTGAYHSPLPFTLGVEAAGVVAAVAPDVQGIEVGQRVAYTGVLGAYAPLAAVPAQRLVPIPEGISTREAAAAMLQGMTAHYLTTSTYPLRQGDSCLIHAAAGGVGLLLCQIARLRGARVMGTVSTEQKAELARDAGAEVILYTREDFVAEVKKRTRQEGVQVVYDSVGRTTFEKGLDCLVPRGMMVLFGQSSGPVSPVEPQLLTQKGSLCFTRPSLNHYIASRDELLRRSSELFGWIREKKLKLRIGAEFPLKDAAQAHRDLESRKTTGKVLLIP